LSAPAVLSDGQWWIVPAGDAAVVYSTTDFNAFLVNGTTVEQFRKPLGSRIAESIGSLVTVSAERVDRIERP
jgi:hypothetical protein